MQFAFPHLMIEIISERVNESRAGSRQSQRHVSAMDLLPLSISPLLKYLLFLVAVLVYAGRDTLHGNNVASTFYAVLEVRDDSRTGGPRTTNPPDYRYQFGRLPHGRAKAKDFRVPQCSHRRIRAWRGRPPDPRSSRMPLRRSLVLICRNKPRRQRGPKP